MTEEKIARINELARKQREQGLSDAEKAEQLTLRREYINSIKRNLEAQLDNTYVLRPDGTKEKVEKKDK